MVPPRLGFWGRLGCEPDKLEGRQVAERLAVPLPKRRQRHDDIDFASNTFISISDGQ